MTKQSFSIPEDCQAVTVEQIGNQIITTFEPGFKRGDVLITKSGGICVLDEIINKNQAIEIVGLIDNEITLTSRPYYFDDIQRLRLATPEEAQRLWDALAKKGKRWNPETMQVEPIKKERWRAKKQTPYFCPLHIDGHKSIKLEYDDLIDIFNFKHGFYCQTHDQSKRLFEVIKHATDKFWEEELR